MRGASAVEPEKIGQESHPCLATKLCRYGAIALVRPI
jgi:hypothetical protein